MLPPQAANKRIRIVGNPDNNNSDGGVSEHDSDDGVVNDGLKQEFPTDLCKVWTNKRLFTEILEYLTPKDVIVKLFSNSKYFKNNKNIIKYITEFGALKSFNINSSDSLNPSLRKKKDVGKSARTYSNARAQLAAPPSRPRPTRFILLFSAIILSIATIFGDIFGIKSRESAGFNNVFDVLNNGFKLELECCSRDVLSPPLFDTIGAPSDTPAAGYNFGPTGAGLHEFNINGYVFDVVSNENEFSSEINNIFDIILMKILMTMVLLIISVCLF